LNQSKTDAEVHGDVNDHLLQNYRLTVYISCEACMNRNNNKLRAF